MTDAVSEEVASAPVPTSDEYVGCFTDMIGDRVLTTVSTDDGAMTTTVSFHSCNRTSGRGLHLSLVSVSWVSNTVILVDSSYIKVLCSAWGWLTAHNWRVR